MGLAEQWPMQACSKQSCSISESYAPGLPLSLFLQVSRLRRSLRRSTIVSTSVVYKTLSTDVAHLSFVLRGRAGCRTCSECEDMSGTRWQLRLRMYFPGCNIEHMTELTFSLGHYWRRNSRPCTCHKTQRCSSKPLYSSHRSWTGWTRGATNLYPWTERLDLRFLVRLEPSNCATG